MDNLHRTEDGDDGSDGGDMIEKMRCLYNDIHYIFCRFVHGLECPMPPLLWQRLGSDPQGLHYGQMVRFITFPVHVFSSLIVMPTVLPT